ncbi:MAG: hypothetical protein WC621_00835 [Patescibacteria group bacterium]
MPLEIQVFDTAGFLARQEIKDTGQQVVFYKFAGGTVIELGDNGKYITVDRDEWLVKFPRTSN